MTKLPFLQTQKLPVLRKQAGVSKYGFSEDDELIENAMSELMHAVDSKDHKKLIDSIKALIECIMAKHSGEDEDASI